MSRLRTRAWTALLLPPLAWFGFERGLSALLHSDCTRVGWGAAWGVASLALCLVALGLGWRHHRRESGLSDLWLSRGAMLVAGFFALAIAFQLLAVAMVPPCVG